MKPGDVVAVRPDGSKIILVSEAGRTGYIKGADGSRTPDGLIDGFLKFGYWESP